MASKRQVKVREERFTIKGTVQEKESWFAEAERFGLNASEWARLILNGAINRGQTPELVVKAEMPK